MKYMLKFTILLAATLSLLYCTDPLQTPASTTESDYLILTSGGNSEAQGYSNTSGQVVIPAGKYAQCFSDTFKTFAMVQLLNGTFAVIDRQENIAYEIFQYDNGPDYPEEGLFRIIVQGKIGYADDKTLAIVIQPQFDCAFPFKNSLAKVSTNCTKKTEGEHITWLSDQWTYIDKKGQAAAEPSKQ